ncbi:hypothetical protein KFU94_67160 [Chloroflexi bacterium TSY]|nr:hypothetical protein [Chloroflexi bacterium TSY]
MSPDAQRILTWIDGVMQLWDIHGRLVATLEAEGPFMDIIFSPDSQHILAASSTGNVDIWSVDGQHIASFFASTSSSSAYSDFLMSIRFSPDGMRILTTIREYADLWNLTGEHICRMACTGALKIRYGIFSPDGTRIITFGERGVYLWDGDGQSIQPIINSIVVK